MPFPLVVEALCIQRGGRAILAGCNLEVAAGEGVAIMGSSGAGKSTLLWSLLGLLVPDSGVVRVMGQIMTGRASRRATIRRDHMGMVFQQAELLPELTVVENVALPLLLSPRPPQDAYDRAHVLLTRLGIEPGTSVSALSGGEQQRVAVARALINEPQVLLADEPTGSLDAVNTREVLNLLLEVTSSQGCALVVVTHDQNVAAAMGRTVTLERGALMSGELSRPLRHR